MKDDLTDYPIRDQRRGYMPVFYPAHIGWFNRVLNWLGKRGYGKKGGQHMDQGSLLK